MATSVEELKALRDLARELVTRLDQLIGIDTREAAAAKKLGEPAPRLARIP